MSKESGLLACSNLGQSRKKHEMHTNPIALERSSSLVSIVIPCAGQLEYTRICVASLLRHSRNPFELIFVDISSLDGTTDFLAGIRTACRSRVEIISIREDTNFSAAFDAGISRSHGRFICLIDNDTIVTPGWLDQMVALVSHDATIGAVGPMSNHASPPQYSGPLPYRLASEHAIRSLSEPPSAPPTEAVEMINRFADRWRDEHKAQWLEVDRLDPFCILFKRDALDRIGPLNAFSSRSGSQSMLLAFDPIRLGQNLRMQGLRMACCHDLFIHSFGSRVPRSA